MKYCDFCKSQGPCTWRGCPVRKAAIGADLESRERRPRKTKLLIIDPDETLRLPRVTDHRWML